MKQDGTVRKFFWPVRWDDEAEQVWLQQMAAQGLHLAGPGQLGWYTFRRGAPASMAYRIDFLPSKCSRADYRQLLTDAGWELAGMAGGRHYWRKPVLAGQEPEIYTDPASLSQKYRRYLQVLVASMLPLTMMLVMRGGHITPDKFSSQATYLLTIGLIAVVWTVAAYFSLRLALRIRSLRRGA